MPELPEVSIIVDQLNRKLKGLVLESIETDWPKKFYWGKFSIKDLRGAKIIGVERRGKVVLINTNHDLTILIHLKLTGQLIYQDAKTRIAGGHPIPPLNLPVPNKTTRVIFTFVDGPTSSSHSPSGTIRTRLTERSSGASHLYFNDVRKFGWVKIVESEESKVKEAIGAELGPDPLVMSYEQFSERLKARGQSRIKKLLMDQNFISGVGNIYSDEALWRAKIHPKRSAVSFSDSEIKALFEGICESLKLAIEKGGSSASAFVDSGAEKGLYLSFAHAYHMTGKPCARCKTPIVREKIDGRSAHYCPACQKLD